MKQRFEWNTIPVMLPWTAKPKPSKHACFSKLVGNANFMSVLIAQVIERELSTKLEGTQRTGLGTNIYCARALSSFAQNNLYLGWNVFHESFVACCADMQPQVMRLLEAAYFLSDDINGPVRIAEISRHLSWKTSTVRKWAAVASQAKLLKFRKCRSGSFEFLQPRIGLNQFAIKRNIKLKN